MRVILFAGVYLALLIGVLGFGVMLLWNFALVPALGVGELNWLHGMALFTLAGILRAPSVKRGSKE